MANIQIISEEQLIKQSSEKLYEFISDFRNFKSLLPADKISNYQSDKDWCEFTITGLTAIKLVSVQKNAPNLIHVKSENVRNIEIEIKIEIQKLEDQLSKSVVKLNADTNAFLKIMVENPLKNLANIIAQKMHDLPIS